MAVSLVAFQQGSSGSAPTCSEPSGAADGDLLVALVNYFDNNRETTITGWTRQLRIRSTTGDTVTIEVWTKVRSGSTGTTTCTFDVAPIYYAALAIGAFRGASSTLGPSSSFLTGTSGVSTIPLPSVTVADNGSFLMASVGSYNDPGNSASSTGLTWTVRNHGVFEGQSYTAPCNAGATGTVSVLNSDSYSDAAVLFVIAPASGGSDITGTAAVTLPEPTVAASGSMTIAGTASVTMPEPTVAAAGALTIAGSAAVTLPEPSLAASGALTIAGTSAVTLPEPGVAGAGAQAIGGTATVVVDEPVIAAIGAESIAGSAAIALPELVVAATQGNAVDGSAAVVLDAPVIAAAGALTIAGSAAVVLDEPVVAATGALAIAGAAAVILDEPTVAATGALAIAGAATLSLPEPTVAAAGSLAIGGAGAVVLPEPAIAAAGEETIAGSAAVLLPEPVILGSQGDVNPGSAALTLPESVIAASGSMTIAGSAAVVLDEPTVSAAGALTIAGSAAVVLPEPAVSALEGTANAGSAAVTLPEPVVAAAGALTIAGFAAVVLDEPTVTATGALAIPGAADVVLPELAVATLGALTITGSASVVLPEPLITTTPQVVITGFAAVVLPEPIVFAIEGEFDMEMGDLELLPLQSMAGSGGGLSIDAGLLKRALRMTAMMTMWTPGSDPDARVLLAVETRPSSAAPWERIGSMPISAVGTYRLSVGGIQRYVRAAWEFEHGVTNAVLAAGGTAYLTYCDPRDLMRVVAESAISDMTPTERADAVIAASTAAEDYLNSSYTLPISAWGDSLRLNCAKIAVAELFFARGFDASGVDKLVVEQKDEAMKWLGRIADGKLKPPGIIDTTPQKFEGGGVVVVSASRSRRGW